MKTWLAAACVLVLVGSIVADVADAGGGRKGKDVGSGRSGGGKGGGGKGGGKHGYSGGGSGGGGTAVISPEDAKEMQKVLAGRGLYTDAIDGIVGPKTIAALKAFQAEEGLAQTGYLDRDSRAKLGLQAPATR